MSEEEKILRAALEAYLKKRYEETYGAAWKVNPTAFFMGMVRGSFDRMSELGFDEMLEKIVNGGLNG